MYATYNKHLCVLSLIIVIRNLIIVRCQIFSDNDPDDMSDIQDPLLQFQSVQFMVDGSGETIETSTDMTMSSVNTSLWVTITGTEMSSMMTTNSVYSTAITSDTTSYSITNYNYTQASYSTEATTSIPSLQQVVNTVRDRRMSAKARADALAMYFNWNNTLTTRNQSDMLTPLDVDDFIDELDEDLIKDGNMFILISNLTNKGNDTVLGGLIKSGLNYTIIKRSIKVEINDSTVSAAAIIADELIEKINRIKILLLPDPTPYKDLDSLNKSVVSPIIIASARRNQSESRMNVSLYFQVLPHNESHDNGQYSCSFFDNNISRWSDVGCSQARYNEIHNRHECTCDHLTTFALIWLSNIVQPTNLTAQDIASLIFLSISILCFIAVVIHTLVHRYLDPLTSLKAHDLIPLISSASTTLLFIFYIALAVTVYTQVSSPSSLAAPCFPSATVLMFFTYFFLIFMFCAKTSVGYFNYLRFVHLFPEPSRHKLAYLLIISFGVSIAWTSFAAGFNSNRSFHIIQLHGNKLCWFTPSAIYYFLTIPVCLFLLLNLITIIFVGKRIINHIQRATSPHQSHERMKQCILVLLSSCVTQGVGWLFGPFISFVNPTAGNVLSWFFIIFNGLEGLWTILLYIIIRSQRADQLKKLNSSNNRRTKLTSTSIRRGNKRKKIKSDGCLDGKSQFIPRRTDRSVFPDLSTVESTVWPTDIYQA